MFDYQDTLSELNKNIPLHDKLQYVHDVLKKRYPFITRIAAALYDPKTDKVKTFVHSTDGESPLNHYEAVLSTTHSLKTIVDNGRPRVVNDLNIFRDGNGEHTQRIAVKGYAASYTLPMFVDEHFFGFLFFNSDEANSLEGQTLHDLDLFGHLIIMVISHELQTMQTMLATVKTARDITHHRDNETGTHLDRMSRFARIIAQRLAQQGKYDFSDEFVERLFLFSPLHDIGKIAIPDGILLKPDRLSEQEFEQMKEHARKGREIIDEMLANFELENIGRINMLRNIAELHHEAIDGSGYPYGLKGNDIPIEARIVAVADVFDALTSARPYKPAWDNKDAFALLDKLSGVKLDADCIIALRECEEEVAAIQKRFQEDPYG